MTDMTLSPQCAAILAELRHGPRTTLELQRACGVLATGARIHDLRVALATKGLTIDTHLIPVRNRHRQRCHVAQYVLRRVPRARSTGKRRAA